MAPSGCRSLRRIFALCLLGLACWAALARGDDSEEPAAAEGAAAEAAGGEEVPATAADDEGSKDPLDSARELNDKLSQLQELLDKSGAGGNEELKDKLAGLKKQLGSLGLDGSGLDGGDEELTEFVNMCVLLAIRRSGMGRSSTSTAFKRIADTANKVEAVVDLELTKLISVCVLEASQDELNTFKAAFKDGRPLTLPAWMVERSKSEDVREAILKGMDAQLWGEVQKLAAKGLDSMKEQLGQDSGLPMTWGVLALVPVVGAVAFLAQRFIAMQKEKDQNKGKKASKKQK